MIGSPFKYVRHKRNSRLDYRSFFYKMDRIIALTSDCKKKERRCWNWGVSVCFGMAYSHHWCKRVWGTLAWILWSFWTWVARCSAFGGNLRSRIVEGNSGSFAQSRQASCRLSLAPAECCNNPACHSTNWSEHHRWALSRLRRQTVLRWPLWAAPVWPRMTNQCLRWKSPSNLSNTEVFLQRITKQSYLRSVGNYFGHLQCSTLRIFECFADS